MGDFVLKSALATESPDEVGVVDAVILGVKACQVAEAAEAMRPLVGSETFLVPGQNGFEAPSQLSAVPGTQHVVVGGLCGIISFIDRYLGTATWAQARHIPSESVSRK